MPIKRVCFAIIVSFYFLSFSSDPIVLQNGLNSYSGCEDTYLATSGNYTQQLTDNFGDKELLKIWS